MYLYIVTFFCSVDGGAAYFCARNASTGGHRLDPPVAGTPRPYDPVAPASRHTFRVTAVDEAGNQEDPEIRPYVPGGSSFNHWSWLVDDRAPIASFIGSPATPPPYLQVLLFSFRFTSDEPGGRFECTLTVGHDDSAEVRVISYSTVSNDPLIGEVHFPSASSDAWGDEEFSFAVVPVDAAGNRGMEVAASWFVDSTPPVTVLKPPIGHSIGHRTGSDSAVFTYSSRSPPRHIETSTFLCALDCLTAAPTRCGDASAADYTITGPDGVLRPVCSLHFTPAEQSYPAGPGDIIAVLSGGSGLVHTADCEDGLGTADSPRFGRCDGGRVGYVGLSAGRHVLRVKAVDAAGSECCFPIRTPLVSHPRSPVFTYWPTPLHRPPLDATNSRNCIPSDVGPEAIYGWTVDLSAPTASLRPGATMKPPQLTNKGTASLHLMSDEA